MTVGLGGALGDSPWLEQRPLGEYIVVHLPQMAYPRSYPLPPSALSLVPSWPHPYSLP